MRFVERLRDGRILADGTAELFWIKAWIFQEAAGLMVQEQLAEVLAPSRTITFRIGRRTRSFSGTEAEIQELKAVADERWMVGHVSEIRQFPRQYFWLVRRHVDEITAKQMRHLSWLDLFAAEEMAAQEKRPLRAILAELANAADE